jgi:hypothetical protein
MPAIITDNLKLQNCTNFVTSIKYVEDNPSSGNYYTFIGYPNPDQYWNSWDANPQNPIDNLNNENSIKESILGVKRITSQDVIRCIPKIVWTSGTRYDMYRHDYSVHNLSPNSGLTRLYDSQYYVMNQDFNVYICINNGTGPTNLKGVPSTLEPTHTDTNEYVDRGDGYVWKYLYTISPSDYLKFDSTEYIPVPNNWETTSNAAISEVRSNAIDGGIRAVLIEKSTKYLVGTNPELGVVCPIVGNGSDASALVIFDSEGYPVKVEIVNPGFGYTYATLDLDSVVPRDPEDEKSIFNVIIPPPGGHGANIYKELGAFRCLVYSRIENPITNPDFIVGNQFARIGIIKNIFSYDSLSYFNASTGSAVFGIALDANSLSISDDDLLLQPSTGALGTIVSSQEISAATFLKYIQSREFYVDTYSSNDVLSTFDPYLTNPTFSTLNAPESYQGYGFNTSEVFIGNDPTTYQVANINGSEYLGEYLGQTFSSGLSNPDINIRSGEILYVDNRSTITRASNQREDIKIIIEF